MATCWHCDSFAEDPAGTCGFCGAPAPGSKPRWVAILDALPAPEDQAPHFGRWYVAWEIILVALGLLYWPWWAALGAVVLGLLVAFPAALVSVVLLEQAARIWRTARARLLLAAHQSGLFAQEEQTRARLRGDQEAFDALIGLMTREKRYRDLMPEPSVVEYRKNKVLPAFGKLVRLSVSALLEMEVRRLINQCEQVCDGAENCAHKELNERYERLETMHRELGAIKKRWSEYIVASVAKPEFAATSEPTSDDFAPALPASAVVLAPEDVARLQGAKDTVRQLRLMLHQTQELQLLRATKPLAGHEASQGREEPAMSSMSMLLRQIQAPDRLGEIEREYQRIVAEQRVIRDMPGHLGAPGIVEDAETRPAPSGGEDFKNRIDAPVILSNSLRRH